LARVLKFEADVVLRYNVDFHNVDFHNVDFHNVDFHNVDFHNVDCQKGRVTLKGVLTLSVDKRVWSLIRNKKPIVLFESHCHATEISEAIACTRSCWSSWLTRWWTPKD
jgi:hypothetical protein